jgi:hypothetical protein
MAANSKRTPRAPSGDVAAPSTGAQRDSGMYLRASRYREELAEEARTLRRAGKIRAAKGVESRVQQVEQLLGALEGEGRTVQAQAGAPVGLLGQQDCFHLTARGVP